MTARTSMEWQPIETAPKGVFVLLYFPDPPPGGDSIQMGRYWPDTVGKSSMTCSPIGQATHWMPLPEPPKETT